MRVAVFGAAGRMGATVCQTVEAAADLELVAAVDPGGEGRPVAGLGPGLEKSALVVAAGPEALLEAGAEAAVDFTVASAATANLAWCAENGVHAVCGTTGLDQASLERLRKLFAPVEAPNAIVAPNFAITAVVLMRLAELAAPLLDGVEIVELHHAQKRDAPSGTAIETARRIAAAREAAGAGPLSADPTEDVVLEGARGASGAAGARIHSVRLPGLLAHQEVLFGAPGQSLLLRQDSYDRVSFMPGVLLALAHVASTPGLTIGLEAFLGF